jgi:hypothetical protein
VKLTDREVNGLARWSLCEGAVRRPHRRLQRGAREVHHRRVHHGGVAAEVHRHAPNAAPRRDHRGKGVRAVAAAVSVTPDCLAVTPTGESRRSNGGGEGMASTHHRRSTAFNGFPTVLTRFTGFSVFKSICFTLPTLPQRMTSTRGTWTRTRARRTSASPATASSSAWLCSRFCSRFKGRSSNCQ